MFVTSAIFGKSRSNPEMLHRSAAAVVALCATSALCRLDAGGARLQPRKRLKQSGRGGAQPTRLAKEVSACGASCDTRTMVFS